MTASSPIRRPSAGSDLGEPTRSRKAGSGAAGMTAASGSASNFDEIAGQQFEWLTLERQWDMLVFKWGWAAIWCVGFITFVPAPMIGTLFFASVMWGCVVLAAYSRAHALYCRGWAEKMGILRAYAHRRSARPL